MCSPPHGRAATQGRPYKIMQITLTMPQFGESITQSRIIHWLKKEGELTQESEPLVEMETEKAIFAYECPFKGKLVKILEQDDTEVAVGTEIARFEVTEEDGKKYLLLGVGREVGEAIAAKSVSPLIRSLAKEHGISPQEVEKIQGTGPAGRVTKEDFQEFLKKRGEKASSRIGVKTISLSPIRARIADNMLFSKQKIPHAGCSVEADLTAIEGWRGKNKGSPGYLPFAVIAAVEALKKFPVINSSWKEVEGRRWIEQYNFIHVGIAVATDQGLMVPVIHDVETLSFQKISDEINRLVEGGKKGALKPQDLTGATFTINNAGALGAVRSSQIIPHPQAAILAMNRVVRRPWVVGEKIEIHPVMNLDLAFDHRIVDGDQAVKFLESVREGLENFDFLGLKTK